MMRSALRMVESRWAITIAGALLQHHVQPFLDLRLGQRVDAGGRLVQDEDGRVLQQHARQRDQLPLAHREAAPRARRPAVSSPSGRPSIQSPPPTCRATVATSSSVASGRP